jgi:hypothetical protein
MSETTSTLASIDPCDLFVDPQFLATHPKDTFTLASAKSAHRDAFRRWGPDRSHTTDESSQENKAPDPNNSATRCYSLTDFSAPLLPRPLLQRGSPYASALNNSTQKN